MKLGRPVPRLPTLDARRVPPPPKVAASLYASPEYRIWQSQVIERAGGRCEVVENGVRCPKGRPRHRVYADHIVEVRDGGALFDPANGHCKCASHHALKTAAARAARR